MGKSIIRFGGAAFPAFVLLGGCGAGTLSTSATAPWSAPQAVRAVPHWLSSAAREPRSFRRVAAPDTAKRGIYVSSFDGSSIYGFKSNYRQGRGPMCTLYTGQVYINDIAADPAGNLIVPQGDPSIVNVYRGPGICGPLLGSVSDPYGQPAGAASLNAATGTIAVADVQGPQSSSGNVAICTLKAGCTRELTNPNITGLAVGIAMAKNGDCWLSSENASFTGTALTYWAHCTGSGEAATGFLNSSYGSLSIDKHGNLVAVDFQGGTTGQLWVYSGCNPACNVVGGPFPLTGQPWYGALNARGNTFGVMETSLYGGTVDIYSYTPTKVAYKYSFASGFAIFAAPEGFAYSPALDQ